MRRPLVLAITALISLAAVPLAVPASAAVPMTTLTMSVTGCEGCTITPSQYRKGMKEAWSGTAAKVSNGVATLTVPTSRTAGMYFAIEATWKVEIAAQPLITMQYKAMPVGGTITRAQAMASRRGSACWAGTTESTAALDVIVKRVLMPAFPPGDHKTSVPLAWVTPTTKSPGGFNSAYKGVLATQDVWVCP